ncbi:26S proteasome regulatory subunit, putative [Theileria equi strain WA]|uniref:26S proteasome regulatory subunit, putative n=1 Tax=Theileria equi strain WA TaxID=1537102 RepID=L0B0Y7_THEEQ|nr:26S proteasome regulatory subunit, putative [Theileria equi strain WA]AFZ81480.1 26S proteasome regulatory subunit, putative [Theileria equi strain WA]|eukprot:XP_004831146.1 26S proteasome regulatory subunit, putative [Theileria equi strain WA]
MASTTAASLLTRVNSAEGILALLEEKQSSCKELGLQQLNQVVDYFWPEVVDSIPVLECLAEDDTFKSCKLAALVISKIYYHMELYGQALQYALIAGEKFDVSVYSEYTNLIVAKAVDEYIKYRCNSEESLCHTLDAHVIAALEALVEKMISMSMSRGEEQHAMGIALDSRRIDLVAEIFSTSKDCPAMLSYTMNVVEHVSSEEFRHTVYKHVRDILINASPEVINAHYSHLCMALYQLHDTEKMCMFLKSLVDTGEHLKAYQIAFDIVDIGDQKFLDAVRNGLESDTSTVMERLRCILMGVITTELHLQFLHRKNYTDLGLLEKIMGNVDQRNTVTHNAIVISHAIMQAGTCCDVFLRDNLSWLAKANNWAKFTATASIGVIHKGFANQSRKVLASYLPIEPGSGSFSEGGALYALGLIHSNHFDPSAKLIILNTLRSENAEEPMHHGAALGLGLVCMGNGDQELYEDLKTLLFRNNAVSGQGAAIGIGLLMIGSGSERVIDELYTFAYETQHEKIIRACVVAIAMVLYRKEKQADPTIKKLCKDSDSIIRYGGMFCYAMAYCGTGSTQAIKDLLYAAVSDVSDDVRRAAVIAIGFVLCNTPEEVPKVLKLLAASYNPHVRYGVTIAIAVSCAATALPEALKIIELLSLDRCDFVRQGAFIAWGLVLQQCSYESNPDIKAIRETFLSVLGDKHQDTMARFGSILGLGLMNAGGQNSIATLYTYRGSLRREAVVGFCMFAQMWYWHAFVHFVSLTLQPTCLIGLNEDLKVPVSHKILCTAPPKLFEYVPHISKTSSQDRKDEVTAVLSISAKRNAWLSHNKPDEHSEAEKEDKPQDDSASVLSDGRSLRAEISSIAATMGHSSRASCAGSSVDNNGDIAVASDTGDSMISKIDLYGVTSLESLGIKHFESSYATHLDNLCRVVPKQARYCVFPKYNRYTPVFEDRSYGVVILVDNTPMEPEEYIVYESTLSEAPPFKPFEWEG